MSPNVYTSNLIDNCMKVNIFMNETDNITYHDANITTESRTELDTYVNMVVIVKHVYVISDSMKTAHVTPFSSEIDGLHDVPLVDNVILFESPFTDEPYILIVWNTLYTPAMNNTWVHLFIPMKAGIEVSYVPQIHIDNPMIKQHYLFFVDIYLHIPLSLYVIFSYFIYKKNTRRQGVLEDENALIMTPSGQWQPHSYVYVTNEENMLDWEGTVIDKYHQKKICVSEIPDNNPIIVSTIINNVESNNIDTIFTVIINNKEYDNDLYVIYNTPSIMGEISSTITPDGIFNGINTYIHGEISQLKCHIGYMIMSNKNWLLDDTMIESTSNMTEIYISDVQPRAIGELDSNKWTVNDPHD